MKQEKKSRNPLPLIAIVVIIAAAAVTIMPSGVEREELPIWVSEPSKNISSADGSDIVIQTANIGADASYFDYNADDVTVQVFALRASDGTIRLALNTCQVCAGSPYAYFVQDGDSFICQNCQNRFASTQVGIISGGCNPVPITDDIFTEQDGTIIIPASFLDESAELFQNWKRF